MTIITLLALATVTLLELGGMLPKGSVGGAMALFVLFLVAALAVGLHEAWSKRRGVPGWIVSIVVAVVGGFVGAAIGGLILEQLLMILHVEGSLAATRNPLLYVSLNGQMLCTLLGSWIALWIVNRLR